MLSEILSKFKFKYLFILFSLGLLVNFQLVFLSILFIFLKIYLNTKKNIYLIFTYVFFTFLIFDFFVPMYTSEKSDYYTNSNIDYDVNKHYGYHPKVSSEFTDRIYFKENLIKTNNYTINEFGHRIVPYFDEKKDKCIVFNGGSFIFGQSLSDKETLPYFVSLKLKTEASVYNYAFNGYGPHQFLSKLENKEIKELIHCKSLILIYMFIPDHVGRVAGRRSWGEDAPRYALKNNKIIQKGFFSNYPYKLIMKIRKNVRNSKIMSLFYDVNDVSSKDKEIFLKVIKKIEADTKKKFNNFRFINIIWYQNSGLWNNEELIFPKIYEYLKSKKYIVVDNLNIEEKFQRNGIPGDQHPTKEFNFILSEEILDIIEQI